MCSFTQSKRLHLSTYKTFIADHFHYLAPSLVQEGRNIKNRKTQILIACTDQIIQQKPFSGTWPVVRNSENWPDLS